MTDAQPVPEADRVTLEGLDPVFDEGHEAHEVSFENEAGESDHGGQGQAEPLTVFEAARLLNKDVKSVLSMIRRGRVCASKDKKTREWVVDGNCLRSQLLETGTSLVKHEQPDNVEAVPMWDIGPEGFRTLLEKLDTAQQQLRDANYRIGYLESQVVGYTEKLQLLPDLQSQAARVLKSEQDADDLRMKLAEVTAQLVKAKQSGWSQFCAWLTGQK